MLNVFESYHVRHELSFSHLTALLTSKVFITKFENIQPINLEHFMLTLTTRVPFSASQHISRRCLLSIPMKE